MTKPEQSRAAPAEKPIVVEAEEARTGVISGRVITVLGISFALAIGAMIVIVGAFVSQ